MPAQPSRLRQIWHDHNLSIVLITAMAAMTAYSLGMGWQEYTSTQQTHGQPVDGPGFWVWWTYEYTQSLVADVFGALLLVIVTKWFRERDSAASN